MDELRARLRAWCDELEDGCSTSGESQMGTLLREQLDLLDRVERALEEIAASARGNGPLSRDRDADTLRGIELFARSTLDQMQSRKGQ